MANLKLKHLHPLFIEDRKNGMMGNEIAKKYNVNNVTVWNVLKKAGLGDRFTLEERFWKQVDVKDNNQCWEWKGCKFKTGYGAIGHDHITLKAHRVSYELHNGKIPENLVVRHKCDNPSCVNPNHLELGTNTDNMKDRDIRKRNVFGERVHKSKLKEADVLEIRSLYKTGSTIPELSKRYFVTDGAIWFIVHNHTWKHLLN